MTKPTNAGTQSTIDDFHKWFLVGLFALIIGIWALTFFVARDNPDAWSGAKEAIHIAGLFVGFLTGHHIGKKYGNR